MEHFKNMDKIPRLLQEITERMDRQNQDLMHMKDEITNKIIEHLDNKLLAISQKNAELEEQLNIQQQSVNF